MTSAGVNEANGPATWGEPVPDSEIVDVQAWLGAPIPVAWKHYVQRKRWLRRGWLVSGTFVTLHSPYETRSSMLAWDEALEGHPGYYQLGTDGSRLLYCVDLRQIDLGVMITDIAAGDWDEADRTGLSLEQFIDRIDDGSFRPYPGPASGTAD